MRKSHNKVPEVNSQSDEILKLKKQIEQDRQEYRLEIGNLKKSFDDLEKQQKRLQDEMQKLKGAQGNTNVNLNNDLSAYKKKSCNNCRDCLYLGAGALAAGYYRAYPAYAADIYGNPYNELRAHGNTACTCKCHTD
ncbi:unnamed protein product, partial [Adineta steineri]